MSNRISDCKSCFSQEICSLSAIALEYDVERNENAGQFQKFQEINQTATIEIKQYFKKFIECITLE